MDYTKGLDREEVLDLIRSLVRIESTTGKEGRISSFIREYLGKHGLETHTVDAGGDGLPFFVRIEGSQRGSIAFVGHMDCVDVEGQDWKHNPFGAEIEDGQLFGRGSSDMKSGLACMIATAIWIKANGFTPKKSVIFAFTIEEEKGYKGARKLTESGVFKDCELIIIPEPTEGKISIGQKGQLWIDATFSGKAAHAALPETGINAAMAAADYAVRVHEGCEKFRNKQGLGRSTGSVDEIHGGWQINVVPNTAKVGVDFRVVDQKDHDLALKIVEDASSSVCLKWGCTCLTGIRQYVEPVVSSLSNEMVSGFINCPEGKAGVAEDIGVVAYSTDGSVIVPVCKAPLIVFGPGSIKKAHQQEEYLVIDEVFQVLEYLTTYIVSCL